MCFFACTVLGLRQRPFTVSGLLVLPKAYLGTLELPAAALPAGRYHCARELRDRRLPFFAGLSLGQLCHVVQLSQSPHRALLGHGNVYRTAKKGWFYEEAMLQGRRGGDFRLVPYQHSLTRRDRDLAAQRAPKEEGHRHGMMPTIQTWDVLRRCLDELLPPTTSAADLGGSLPLSTLKEKIRKAYGLVLSETELGYTRLSQIFLDERVRDLYVLECGRGPPLLYRRRAPDPDSHAASLAKGQNAGGQGTHHHNPDVVDVLHNTTLVPAPESAHDATARVRKRGGRRRLANQAAAPRASDGLSGEATQAQLFCHSEDHRSGGAYYHPADLYSYGFSPQPVPHAATATSWYVAAPHQPGWQMPFLQEQGTLNSGTTMHLGQYNAGWGYLLYP